eukprot:m.224520 g.224520  ORF g.224520 m.224520 type:complete len:417 (-) comp16484_c0_seq1:88-1338(-)
MAWEAGQEEDWGGDDGAMGYFDAGQDVWEVDFQTDAAFDGFGDFGFGEFGAVEAGQDGGRRPARRREMALPQSNVEQARKEERRVSRLSMDAYSYLRQSKEESHGPLNRPTRKLRNFQVEEEENEYQRRKQREKEEYDEMVRQQRSSHSAEHLAYLRQQELLAAERNRELREMEERRHLREEEFKRQKEAAVRARREREAALRETQRMLDEMALKKKSEAAAEPDEEDEEEISEEQLIEKQKQILLMERELQEKKAALEAKLGTRSYEPLENEFETSQDPSSGRAPPQQGALKFVVNPGWGIDSIAPKSGGPLNLVQIRKLIHLPHAPSLNEERTVILVVLSDHSFLCVQEPAGLRLLFPPCENDKVMWGPALARTYETMFSLRFDDLGPFYMLGESQSEAKYWMKMFAPPTMPEF